MKIVLNKNFGGFEIPKAVYKKMRDLFWFDEKQTDELTRTDEKFVKAVEECQKEGTSGYLRVIEIPDDMDWEIFDYDGLEYVYDKHRFF